MGSLSMTAILDLATDIEVLKKLETSAGLRLMSQITCPPMPQNYLPLTYSSSMDWLHAW